MRTLLSVFWSACALGIAVVFINAAIQKLGGDAAGLAPFREAGLPLWTADITAIAEIVFAIGLVIPQTRTPGGLGLSFIMIGAAVTNVANGHPDYLWLNAVLLIGSSLLAWQGARNRRRSKSSERDDVE